MIPLVVTVLAFAAWCTAHVALAVGVARAGAAWRGLVAFILPPVAPVFGFRARLTTRASVWCVTLLVYLVALFALSRV